MASIERQALRRGDFASVEELMAAIRRFCDGGNQRWHPFTWTKDADQILTSSSVNHLSSGPLRQFIVRSSPGQVHPNQVMRPSCRRGWILLGLPNLEREAPEEWMP